MKRILIEILIAALLLSVIPTVFAEPLCDPSEVYLSGVQEIDGRLVGEIRVPDGLLKGELRIDCPLPESFTQEQSQNLTVEYKLISDQEMIAALQAIGQGGTKDTVRTYDTYPQTFAEFSLLKCGSPGYYFTGTLMNADASADPAYEAEYEQAKGLVKALIAQLGGTAYKGLLHAMRLDAEHAVSDSVTARSNGPAQKARVIEAISDMEAKYDLTPNTLTTVSGLYELYGLPVMKSFTWMEGEYLTAAESAFSAAVHDDGTLQYCMVESLPIVTDTEPVCLPVRNWRELLAGCVANGWCLSNAHSADDTFFDPSISETVTLYASYAIITELHPCWVGNAKDRLVPGYYMNVEERVTKDDSLICPWGNFGDAQTLTSIF